MLFKRSMILGLTGQTGAGKTTVADALKEKSCLIIDADQIAREVVKTDSKCLCELIEEFGVYIRNDDGSLNRKELARIAFSDESKTDKLNNITHPFIIEEIKHIINRNNSKYKVIVIDAPLLIESGLNQICDIIISVTAPEDIRLDRIIKRDNLSKSDALKRIRSQKDDNFYVSNSHFILDGSVSKLELQKRATDFINKVVN